MGKKNNKCPFCDSKMVLNNNRYKCIKCGYSISDSSVTAGSGLGTGSSITSGSTGGKKIWKIAIPAAIVLLGGGGAIQKYMPEQTVSRDYDYENYEDITSDWEDEYDTEQEQDSYLPESELFQKFVSEAFQKDYTEVTKEEYASITSICLGNDYDITYSISDGEENVIYFGEYLSEDMEDLKCFPGLKRLDLSNAMYILYEDDLNELTNLEEIGLREAPETFAGLISDKENIRSITIGDGFSIDSLKGIEEFQNLEALYIKAGQITELSNLSSLEHLETLVIEDGSRINNFGTLASLKNLKKILIRSENLKNIDFMDEMPQLEDVAICGSAIKSIEPLRSHNGTLRQLTLLENYDVTDYSLVDEFTELEEASIGVSYDDILPTFAGMKNLKKLYVEGADDISFAGNAVNVTELTLSYSNLENLAVLNRLSNLKELHINDTKSYTKTLSPLMELTGLEVLDISGTYIFGYVEELLSLPNLQEFCMDGCHVAFDFNKLTGNENLKILSMNEAEVIDYGTEYDPNEYYSSGEGTQIDVSNYAQEFQNFPNLTELYMVGTGLENIEFAKGLSKLEVLNISDNYISSVAPLKELKNLKMLWCEDNDITDLSELGEHVNIIEE